ncbi:MAG: ABC transporter ATP-binding protein [Bacteroidales bacterium]|nr:ABC transporter ATP-binding protein [Bacteroidales bacterium]
MSPAKIINSVLELENVSLGYDRVIYSAINASAKSGEMIAVVGANGMGKSTLLRSLSGILKYHGGVIKIDGENVSSYTPGQLSIKISYVPSQSPRTKNLSLFDMVSAGCYNRSNWLGIIDNQEREFVSSTIIKVGLTDFISRDSSMLSDGEFQRAAIARSLVQNSKIMLLDEPTAFLDIANRITTVKLLKEIASKEGKTIIFSTHDLLQAIKLCDKIWVMGHDSFIEGTPDELIEKRAFDKMFKDSSLKFDSELFTFL